ncbi:uncharacterized protein [Macrobrachium rosenbergii]|uniref:uncharacterized protein n=1 Tax=Macrobrachium rosenbergii TaxID=79674 RepID=UPI0034D772BE
MQKALQQEIQSMLDKGAVEIVREKLSCFYSHLFLVEKASGRWKPVTDLSTLNRYLHMTPFKMETPRSVLAAIRRGDFMISLDLQDAYLQIPVHPSSRKFLRVVSRKITYQFRALCFGLVTAPQPDLKSNQQVLHIPWSEDDVSSSKVASSRVVHGSSPPPCRRTKTSYSNAKSAEVSTAAEYIEQWPPSNFLVRDGDYQSPYEPVKTATDWNLTLKTVFLLALESVKRVGEILALSYDVTHL